MQTTVGQRITSFAICGVGLSPCVFTCTESNNMANVSVEGLSVISKGVQNNMVKILKKYTAKVAKDERKNVVDSCSHVGRKPYS